MRTLAASILLLLYSIPYEIAWAQTPLPPVQEVSADLSIITFENSWQAAHVITWSLDDLLAPDGDLDGGPEDQIEVQISDQVAAAQAAAHAWVASIRENLPLGAEEDFRITDNVTTTEYYNVYVNHISEYQDFWNLIQVILGDPLGFWESENSPWGNSNEPSAGDIGNYLEVMLIDWLNNVVNLSWYIEVILDDNYEDWGTVDPTSDSDDWIMQAIGDWKVTVICGYKVTGVVTFEELP